MDSGIYRLTYANGDTYVGKSIHLTVRWKQHFDKLSKGTAAKNMMEAYYRSDHQFPQTEVLVYCHPDMLDKYEGYFINLLKPPLNTQIPELLPESEQRALIRHMQRGNANFSIPEILEHIEKYWEIEENLNSSNEYLADKVARLTEDWDDRALQELYKMDKYNELLIDKVNLDGENEMLNLENEKLTAFKRRVLNANWWQRLWGDY